MRSNRRYTLWFVNESLRSGQVCLYHDPLNTACSQAGGRQLAWRVASANPQVQVCFEWEITYDFLWIDAEQDASTRQSFCAEPAQGSSVVLSKNPYGYTFTKGDEPALRGQLEIQTDRSIDPGGSLRIGIAMAGGASFALPTGPNLSTVFIPKPAAELIYWISFGYYNLRQHDTIDLATFNAPTRICFPRNVDTMTAMLDRQNEWKLSSGAPALSLHPGRQPA